MSHVSHTTKASRHAAYASLSGLLVSCIGLALTACGGGGSSGAATPEGTTDVSYVAVDATTGDLQTGQLVGSGGGGTLHLGAQSFEVAKASDGSLDVKTPAGYLSKSYAGGQVTMICNIHNVPAQSDRYLATYLGTTAALHLLSSDELNLLSGKEFVLREACGSYDPNYVANFSIDGGGSVQLSVGPLNGVMSSDLAAPYFGPTKNTSVYDTGNSWLRAYRVIGTDQYFIFEQFFSAAPTSNPNRVRIWELTI